MRFTERVNLREAFRVINNNSSHRVVSTPALARAVNRLSPNGDLVEVPHLDSTFTLRPLDVLLALSMATRALVEQDVLIAYQSWAKWRYLGVFDGAVRHEPLGLSLAGSSIRGNQRRVMSEELGIGFSVKVAEQWMNPRSDPQLIVRTVDVDAALSDSEAISGLIGKGVSINSVSTRRPDYFVIADDPSSLARFTIGTLESKGTSASKNSTQLSSANQQLRGITVNGSVPPGLAVGTMLNSSGVTSNALQLPQLHDADLERLAVEIDLDSVDFRTSLKTDRQRTKTVPETLIGGVLSSSWANLGEASGNATVFSIWASEEAKRRPSIESNQQRRFRQTRDGESYVGTELQIPVQGGKLTVFTGIERELEEALITGNAERILSKQRSQKRRNEEFQSSNKHEDVDEPRLEAISDDGAIVVLDAEFDD